MKEKKIGAFVTIEYSLLFPLIFMLFSFLVYIGIYLYNRCIFQSNIYIMAIEAARIDEENQKIPLQEFSKNKYLLRHMVNVVIQVVDGMPSMLII